MPNWTANFVRISHTDVAMMDRLEKACEGQGGVFQEFIPCPADLLDTMSGFHGDEQEQAELLAKQNANQEKYGYSTWYDHNVHVWGTKWDITEVDNERLDPNSMTLNFDTAWSPPIEAYSELTDLGFEIQAFYYEPGMAFCGQYDSDFGNTEYSLEDYTADEIRDTIGAEVDDLFNISENMREWEDDNEEDEEPVEVLNPFKKD